MIILYFSLKKNKIFCFFQKLKNDHEESEDYKQGFENTIMEVHRQYNLRSKKSTDNPTKKTPDNSTKRTTDTSTKKILDVPPKKNTKIPTKRRSNIVSKTTQTDIPSTSQPKDTSQKEVGEKQDVSNPNKT